MYLIKKKVNQIKPVTSDEQYLKGQMWLVDEANRLEGLEINDKDMHPDKKAELIIKYDQVCEQLEIYKNDKAIAADSSLKESYREYGWRFTEIDVKSLPDLPEPKRSINDFI